MSDLISREALIEDGNNTRVWVTGWNENPSLAHQVLKEQGATFKKLVLEAPAVDAVEVVRCKDCKHYGTNTVSKLKTCYVHILTPHPMPEDAFCSYGEPRGERKE